MKKKKRRNAARVAAEVAEHALSYRVSMAAVVSGMSTRTIQRLISEGLLPSIKIGAIRLVRRKSLEQFLVSRENAQE